LGPGPIGMRALVASGTRSRRPLIASPRISSERPVEYTFAVSMKLMPRSRQRSIWRVAPAASVEPTAAKFPLPPNVMVPSVSAETLRPEEPS
jgi:hypothetical protein